MVALCFLFFSSPVRAQVLEPAELEAIAASYADTISTSQPVEKVGRSISAFKGRLKQVAQKCGMVEREMDLAKFPGGTLRYLDQEVSVAGLRGMFMVTPAMQVNTDGAARTYHPLDPFGECKTDNTDPETTRPACALNYLCYGGVKLHVRGKEVACTVKDETGKVIRNSEYADTWRRLWAKLQAGELRPFTQKDREDLKMRRGETIYGFRDVGTITTVAFKSAIIPADSNWRPCRRDVKGAKFFGYFVNSTALKGDEKKDEIEEADPKHIVQDSIRCNPLPDANSERVPGLVIPSGAFDGARVGDAVVVYAKPKSGMKDRSARWVFGVVGDKGPRDKFGEASMAMLGQANGVDVDNRKWKDVREIWRTLVIGSTTKYDNAAFWEGPAVMIIRGTDFAFKSDYSRDNVRATAQVSFARWGGSLDQAKQRFLMCREALLSDGLATE